MNEVTKILCQIASGDPTAAEQLLPLVYDELRKLAAQKLAKEKSAQTLDATALVHEAYLRLVETESNQHWNSRGHFFGAAAEAMRRILVESARRKQQARRGGRHHRVCLDEADIVVSQIPSNDLLALHEALEKFETHDPVSASLVKLRYFAGLTMAQAAEDLGIGLRTAERNWTYARTWLHREISRGENSLPS